MLFLDMLEAIPCSSYVSLLNKPQPIHHLKADRFVSFGLSFKLIHEGNHNF